MADPNIELLEAMALALGPLRERMVFVGGCATGLLLTNLLEPIRTGIVIQRLLSIASLPQDPHS